MSDTLEQWNTVLKPKTGLVNIPVRELIQYRDLIGLFVRRDFVAVYKQTILGPIWFILQPLFTTVVFTIIFGNIAKISTDGIPHVLFYFSGIILWNYFAACLTQTSDTFIANSGMFGKVYFPRLITPIAITVSNLISFAIQFVVFAGLLVFFIAQGAPVRPGWTAVFAPLLLLNAALLGLGVGTMISAMTTKYRDLKYLVGFGVQLWMYATPIVYPISQVAEEWRWVFLLNPMAGIVETFRQIFLGSAGVEPLQLLIGGGVSLLLLFSGLLLFSRIERTFMDTV